MLFGTLVNRARRALRLDAGKVRVLDANDRPLPAAAAFSAGYEASIALRGLRGEMFAGGSARTTAVLSPNTTVPLSVSWSGRAVAVEVAGSRLPLD